MKQDPLLDGVREQMKPGIITRDGFLGDDARQLATILDEDQATVNRLGLDHETIATRLRQLMQKAREGLGTDVEVDGKLLVRADDVRGDLPCPWPHGGLYAKTNVRVRNIETGDTLMFTGLQIHLIGAHGFYEGRGSRFRLEPEKLKRILGL